MRITLEMLLEKLRTMHPDIRIEGPETDFGRHIAGVRLYSPGISVFSEEYLYIGEKGEEDDPGRGIPPLFLCCCRKTSRLKDADRLRIVTKLDVAEILNTLQEIYAQFQSWDREMHEALIRSDPLPYLLEKSREYIDHPILIFDLSLKLLAYNEIDTRNDELMKTVVSQGYLPSVIIPEFKRAGVFSGTQISEPLVLTPLSLASETALYQPFYHASVLCGYCVMLIGHPDPSRYERTMFANFHEFASVRMEQMMKQQNTEGFMYEFALRDILDNPDLSEAAVRDRISYIGLPYESDFILICLNTEQAGASIRSYLLGHLRSVLDCARVFEYKEQILILIFGNSRLELLSYRQQIPRLYPEILRVMESYSLCAYCSMPFYSITGIRGAWRMSQEAAGFQKLSGAEENTLFFFEDHIIGIMNMQVIEATDHQPSIPTCLKIMIDEDALHDTRNALIVRTYLEENCRITETAERLHMHRNNIVYHIQRIREKYQIDFSSQSERMNLQLAFRLIDLLQQTEIAPIYSGQV